MEETHILMKNINYIDIIEHTSMDDYNRYITWFKHSSLIPKTEKGTNCECMSIH